MDFKYPRVDGHYSLDPMRRDDDICLEENWFLKQLEESGPFKLLETHYGSSSGRQDSLSTQDIVIVQK